MLELTIQPEGASLRFEPEVVALAGFSGRDQMAVRQHIEELRKMGVRTPEAWPVVYAVTTDRVTTAERIEVLHGETSGEIEFAVLVVGEERYVAVASDHTDRRGERIDIALSKQAVKRVISRDVWRTADVAERWDEVTLESYVRENGQRRLYQRGRAAALLPADDLVALVRERAGRPIKNAVIFSGTVPLIGGAVAYAPRFEMEMHHPGRDWVLRGGYDVYVNEWLADPSR